MKELDELQKGLQSKLSRMNHDAHTTDTSRVLSASDSVESQGTRFDALAAGDTVEPAQRPVNVPVITNIHCYKTGPTLGPQKVDEAHRTSPVGSLSQNGRLERDGLDLPERDQDFSQGDLDTKLEAVVEHIGCGTDGLSLERSQAEDRRTVFVDSRAVKKDEVFEQEDNISKTRFCEVNEEKHQDDGQSGERCISEEDSDTLEESGYINENVTQRFMQEHDSWVSSDEEDNQRKPERTVMWDDKPKSDPDVNEAIHYITSLSPAIHDFTKESTGTELEQGEGKTAPFGNSREMKMDEQDPNFEHDGLPINAQEHTEQHRTSIGVLPGFEPGAHSDPNSSSEEDVQSTFHSTVPAVPALPNFFLPTEQLEQSMRAVRLAASLGTAVPRYVDTMSKSKLLSRTGLMNKPGSGTTDIAEEFAKRKLVYAARKGTDPPISSVEAQRIARIFASKNMV